MPAKDMVKRKAWYRKRAATQKYKEYQKKFRADHKEYFSSWLKNNPVKSRGYSKKWKDKNKAKCNEKMLRWYAANPWVRNYASAKNRCENPKCEKFPRYGGRGIQFLLSKEDVKKLWERDGAWKMKSPTIDRIDNDGNYEFSNCQFLSKSDHSKKTNKERKGGKP